MAFKRKEFDDFKNCRICKKELLKNELEFNLTSNMPAMCSEHIKWAKTKITQCLKLYQTMKF